MRCEVRGVMLSLPFDFGVRFYFVNIEPSTFKMAGVSNELLIAHGIEAINFIELDDGCGYFLESFASQISNAILWLARQTALRINLSQLVQFCVFSIDYNNVSRSLKKSGS